jgi:hypothetical protein
LVAAVRAFTADVLLVAVEFLEALVLAEAALPFAVATGLPFGAAPFGCFADAVVTFAGAASPVFFAADLAGAFFVALTLAILISLQICGTKPL